MELHEILNSIHPLPDGAYSKLAGIADEVTVGRNGYVVKAGRTERHIYFVRDGLLRAYVSVDGREVTFWIGDKGSVALSMESYVNNRPGYETITAIEDTSLYRIGISALQQLYATDIHIANWGRKFAEQEILRAERCLIPQLFTTATKRYEDLLRSHPDLLNRMPLEHISSYLGITPVSLSRIRAAIARNGNRG